MYTDMENWAEIRRRVLVDGLSKRCRLPRVRHPLGDPPARSSTTPSRPATAAPAPAPRPKLEPFLPVIHQILEDDKKAPKKQRHTAKRIFERLRDEHGYTGGLTVVKDAVRAWRRRSRRGLRPAGPPARARPRSTSARPRSILDGQPTKVALFVMTLPYSDAIFVVRLPRECTEAFLEGHVRAFEFFGGVPRRISYDNSRIAVAKIPAAATARSPTRSSGSRAITSSRPTSAWCGGPTRRGTSRRSSASPAGTSSCRSRSSHGGLGAAQRPTSTADCREDLTRRTCGASRRPRPSCSTRSGPSLLPLPAEAFVAARVEPPTRRLAVAGPLRRQRLLGPDRVRPSPGHGRRDGRRRPHRGRRPRGRRPPPVLGPRAGHLRPGALPGRCWSASPGRWTSPRRLRAGSCRSASASCAGGWRPSSAGRGPGSSSRSCGCWSGPSPRELTRAVGAGPGAGRGRRRRGAADPGAPAGAAGGAVLPRRPAPPASWWPCRSPTCSAYTSLTAGVAP